MRETRLHSGLAQRHSHIKCRLYLDTRDLRCAFLPNKGPCTRARTSRPAVVCFLPGSSSVQWLTTDWLGPNHQAAESVCERTCGDLRLGERRTADPLASLGMTKWRLVAFIKSRQIGWTGKQQVPPLRFHGSPGQAFCGPNETAFSRISIVCQTS
jgi:hypothetical protein